MALQVSAFSVAPNGFKNIVETDRHLVRAAFSSRPGAVDPRDFAPSGSAGMRVNFAAGRYVLRSRESEKQGFYLVWSDATDYASIPAAPAAGTNPRIDTVLLRVADPQYGAVTGTVGARFDVIKGTAAASPVPVTDSEIAAAYRVPGAWERLCDVKVNAGVTNINNADIMANRLIAGGQSILPAASAAEIEAITAGQYRDRIDLQSLQRAEGAGQWRHLVDSAAWVEYTPTWRNIDGSALDSTNRTSVGTGGVNLARWKRVGRTVFVQGRWAVGTGAAGGYGGTASAPVNGRWRWALPTSIPALASLGGDLALVGHCVGYQRGKHLNGAVFAANTDFLFTMGGSAEVGVYEPQAWLAGEQIRYSFHYETTNP